MPTVAEQLCRAREAQKLTIYQVAETTKIRTDHLRALEEGNFDVFAAPVYIRGFVRSYATLLKLDVPQVMAALDSELGQTERFKEPPPLSPGSRSVLDFVMLQLSKMNWRTGLAVVVGIALLVMGVTIYRAVRHHRTADPLAGAPPAVYHPTQTNTSDTLPLPQAPAPRRQ
jgi:cytoskeletal protein RodZ